MKLANSADLIEGTLQLLKAGKIVNEYRATSSLPGRQYSGSWGRKGGLIPPSTICPNYEVSVCPIDMFDLEGVNGNFYAISPFEQNIKGVTRGDFGIHADWWRYGKGSKGTLGCIGLETKEGMGAFDRDLTAWRRSAEDSQESIPLQVIYL